MYKLLSFRGYQLYSDCTVSSFGIIPCYNNLLNGSHPFISTSLGQKESAPSLVHISRQCTCASYGIRILQWYSLNMLAIYTGYTEKKMQFIFGLQNIFVIEQDGETKLKSSVNPLLSEMINSTSSSGTTSRFKAPCCHLSKQDGDPTQR